MTDRRRRMMWGTVIGLGLALCFLAGAVTSLALLGVGLAMIVVGTAQYLVTL